MKPSDSRTKSYVEEYGRLCWETDVLPAAVIEQAIEDNIRSWLDERAWNRRDREIKAARELL